MTDHVFRFGIVAGQPDPSWPDVVRRIESQGYDIVLVPDTLHTLSPQVACAAAAAVTSTLRVGTHVLSAPNRHSGLVASEVASLHTLTGGRYELGIGAGRPGARADAEVFGMPFGSAAARMRQVQDTVDAVRAQSPDTTVMIAASGPKMLSLAAGLADTITLSVAPQAGPQVLADTVSTLRSAAGTRFDELELAQNLLMVGDEAPPWLHRLAGVDPAELRAAGAPSVLTGTTAEMVDTLRRRRDQLGISYVSTSVAFAEAFAPVVAALAGT